MKWPFALISTVDLECKATLPQKGINVGTVVLRARDISAFHNARSNKTHFRNSVVNNRGVLTSKIASTQISQAIVRTRPESSVQVMWNNEIRLYKQWLSILQFRNVQRFKIAYDKDTKKATCTDEHWYTDVRMGWEFGTIRIMRWELGDIHIYARRRKRPESTYEFWVVFQKTLKCEDDSEGPTLFPGVEDFVIIRFEKAVLSSALSVRLSKAAAETKPRNISSLFIFGLTGLLTYAYLQRTKWNFAHGELATNLLWASLFACAMGAARTIAFWSNNSLGFGIAFFSAAAFAERFDWTVFNIPAFGVLGVAAILFLFYAIVPALFALALWLAALFFFSILPFDLYTGSWRKDYDGNIGLAILAYTIYNCIGTGLSLIGLHFARRQAKLAKQAFWRWNRPKTVDSNPTMDS